MVPGARIECAAKYRFPNRTCYMRINDPELLSPSGLWVLVASGKQLNFRPVLFNERRQHHCGMAKSTGIHLLSRTVGRLFGAMVPAVLLCGLPTLAQQQSTASSGALPVSPVQEQISLKDNSFPGPAAPVESQIALKNHRLFGVLTDYTSVETREQFGTLSPKTKFKLSAKTMADPVMVSLIGMIALIGQARNSNPSYGQGFQGYEKRFGTFFADSGIGTVMTTSVFPTLLHQDPRYFQLGRGGKWHRVMYSVSRTFITRADSGELEFNYSEIVGDFVAAGISNAYHPQNQRTLGNTLNVWGTHMILNTLGNVAKEFWPDIRREIHRQKHPN